MISSSEINSQRPSLAITKNLSSSYKKNSVTSHWSITPTEWAISSSKLLLIAKPGKSLFWHQTRIGPIKFSFESWKGETLPLFFSILFFSSGKFGLWSFDKGRYVKFILFSLLHNIALLFPKFDVNIDSFVIINVIHQKIVCLFYFLLIYCLFPYMFLQEWFFCFGMICHLKNSLEKII